MIASSIAALSALEAESSSDAPPLAAGDEGAKILQLLKYHRFGRREARYRLNDCAHTELCLRVFKISGSGVPRNAKDLSCLPGRFSLSGPFETFKFTGRQRHVVDKAIGNKLATSMRVEIYRHELQHPAVLVHSPFELWSPLVSCKRHRRGRATIIVNWNREPAADAKLSGFLEKLPL